MDTLEDLFNDSCALIGDSLVTSYLQNEGTIKSQDDVQLIVDAIDQVIKGDIENCRLRGMDLNDLKSRIINMFKGE